MNQNKQTKTDSKQQTLLLMVKTERTIEADVFLEKWQYIYEIAKIH